MRRSTIPAFWFHAKVRNHEDVKTPFPKEGAAEEPAPEMFFIGGGRGFEERGRPVRKKQPLSRLQRGGKAAENSLSHLMPVFAVRFAHQQPMVLSFRSLRLK
jgi:hypothetical protein